MTSLFHSLHIGTLATWLSVAGFGTVAVVVPNRSTAPGPRPELLETQWEAKDFTLGGESSPASAEASAVEPTPADPSPSLPAPPDLPDLTELAPLPDVPDPLPAPTPDSISPVPVAPRPGVRQEVNEMPARPVARKPAAARSSSSATGLSVGGAAMSSGARLAAGRMPSPAYPAEARRLGQSGTLIVEFTVDTSGRVISAYAKSPSIWSLLNEEAVRTVRRWKFPPGPVMKLQRPIVFQLR